jgi:6-phosphogluconolactonase (cycloisomerase 2 family)
MNKIARGAAALGLLSISLAGPIVGPHAGAKASDAAGFVYVDDNTAIGGNTVAGFSRNEDGTLTALPGSPFAVGGTGLGSGIGSQDALQLSADGRYLLAADAGSNQISVLRIHHDGSLQQVEGSPVASGGVEPVSIAVHGSLVYVANTGAGGSGYAGFTLNAGGQLTPLAGSFFAVPDLQGLGDMLFNNDGTRLIGTRINPSTIDSFTVTNGLLSAAPGSPFTAQGAGPFGSEFRPTNPTQLYVSNAHNGGVNLGTVSAFNDAPNGVLSSIGPSPYADNQNAPCWVSISPDGQFLFADNTASDSVSRYTINGDGSLSLLGSTTINGLKGVRPTDLRLDPSGSNLYVLEAGHNAVGAFSQSAGNLGELAASPTALPAGAFPFGIVVTSPFGFSDN